MISICIRAIDDGDKKGTHRALCSPTSSWRASLKMAGNGPGALFNREKDPSNNKEKNESKNENLM